jgi:hypothetical protein
MRLEHLLESIAQLIGRAHDIQLRLLTKCPEWLGLLELFLQRW